MSCGLRKAAKAVNSTNLRLATGVTSSRFISTTSMQQTSMSMSIDSFNDSYSVETTASSTVQETPKIKTAGDFIKVKLKTLRSPTLIRSLNSLDEQTISEPITISIPQPVPELTNNIRSFLVNQDYDCLVAYLQNLKYDKDTWKILYRSMPSQELSRLIMILKEQHAQSYKERTLYRYSSMAKEQKYSSTKAYQIGFILRDLRNGINEFYQSLHPDKKNSSPFSQVDYDCFLSVEIQSSRLFPAYQLIQKMEALGLTNSIYYQNIKLRVLGNTNPKNWQLNKPGHGKRKSTRMNRYSPSNLGFHVQPISELLNELSKTLEISQIRPNLQTHKEIIGGFGRVGDLTQIKSHLAEVWGIGSNSTVAIDVNNTIYPDMELLRIIITCFGFNGQFGESLPILNEFMEKYPTLSTNQIIIPFWKVLFKQIELNYKSDDKAYAKYFEMFWTHMLTAYSGKRNITHPAIYGKRLTYLCQLKKYDGMLSDLPVLYEAHNSQPDIHIADELKYLISQYLITLSKGIFSNINDYSNEDEVNLFQEKMRMIIDRFVIDQKQKSYVTRRCEEVQLMVKKEKTQYKELQNQYDEEDEENSIW